MRDPTLSTIKRLFAVSGNRCAFPNCNNPLVDYPTGTVIGKICHIRAASSGGPRYDSNQTDNERRSFENLILMCPIHHDVIDADPESYTVQRLLEIKANHETIYSDDNEPSDDIAYQLIANIDVDTIILGSTFSVHNQTGGQIAHSITNFNPHMGWEHTRKEINAFEQVLQKKHQIEIENLEAKHLQYVKKLATNFIEISAEYAQLRNTVRYLVPDYIKQAIHDFLLQHGKPKDKSYVKIFERSTPIVDRSNIQSGEREVDPILENMSFFYFQGRRYASQGDYRKAVANFTEAIRFNPTVAEIYVHRGVIYAEQGNYRKAIEDFGKATNLSPGNAEAFMQRGFTYAEQQDYQKAIVDFGEVIRLNPKDGYANKVV